MDRESLRRRWRKKENAVKEEKEIRDREIDGGRGVRQRRI